MTRTTAFLVAALTLLGCSSAASRAATVPNTTRPRGELVYASEQGYQLRLPHERWSVADAEDHAAITLIHARRDVTVTVTTRDLEEAGFIATLDVVRREAVDAGCEMRRGSARHVTDRFGRRATMAARRTVDGEIQDGEITVLTLEGRDGAIVVSGWWPELPMGWVSEDIRAIVESIRLIPGR